MRADAEVSGLVQLPALLQLPVHPRTVLPPVLPDVLAEQPKVVLRLLLLLHRGLLRGGEVWAPFRRAVNGASGRPGARREGDGARDLRDGGCLQTFAAGVDHAPARRGRRPALLGVVTLTPP